MGYEEQRFIFGSPCLRISLAPMLWACGGYILEGTHSVDFIGRKQIEKKKKKEEGAEAPRYKAMT